LKNVNEILTQEKISLNEKLREATKDIEALKSKILSE